MWKRKGPAASDASAPTESSSSDEFEYNPVATDLLDSNVSKEEVTRRAAQLAEDVGLAGHEETITRGAHLAYDPRAFYREDASDDEKRVGPSIYLP